MAAIGTQQVRYHEQIVNNTFDIFHNFIMITDLLSPNRCHWWMAKVKNYNLNVTEILDSGFKNAFLGIFNFTVGILILAFRMGPANSGPEVCDIGGSHIRVSHLVIGLHTLQ